MRTVGNRQYAVGNKEMGKTMAEVDAYYEGLIKEIKELQEMLGDRDQRSEIRDQRSEIRGQRSEVRDQRSDNRIKGERIMQQMNDDGSRGPIEPFDSKRMETMLDKPEVKEVRVFRLRPRMRLTIHGATYKVISARPNGKVTMKLIGGDHGQKEGKEVNPGS